MTISATYSPDTYAGDGATTTFAITFAFLSVSTNVKVSIKVDATGVITEKTAGTHYNVSGSNVVFTAGNIPASGETIIVELNPDFKQTSDYSENTNFPAETLETDLDERTLESQFNKDQALRAVKIDASVSLASFDPTLPTPEADKFIGFNGDATAMITKTVAQLGTISLPLSVSDGGTGSTSASTAASALGVGTEDSPEFTNVDLSGHIRDDDDNELIKTSKTASAVNELTVANAATGNAPSITATGDDTNVGLTIDTKGTGTLTLGSADAPVTLDTDTLDAQTASVSRLDINDSGVRLGGANARVTTILDEDTMSSDSATALATQQSIKAYVDSASGGGKVLQVVQSTKTDTASIASSTITDLGLSASITPASTSNKVLVIVTLSCGSSVGGGEAYTIIDRAGTDIGLGDAASNRTQITGSNVIYGSTQINTNTIVYLDSPATTASTTYKVQWRNATQGGTTYLNRSSADSDTSTYGRAASFIQLLEIDGS